MFQKACSLSLALLFSFFYTLAFGCFNFAEAIDWQALCVKGDIDEIREVLAAPVKEIKEPLSFTPKKVSGDNNIANALLSGGNRPLHIAAEYASGQTGPEIIKILVEHGADLTAKGLEGLTPLMLAAAYNPNPAVTEALLQVAANSSVSSVSPDIKIIDMLDANGRTPLHLAAAMNDEPEVLATLLRYAEPALIRKKDKEDRTPLWLSASRADEQMTALLLDALSGDIPALALYANEPNREGITPLHIACERPDAKVIDLLLKAGADVNLRDPHRYTPLMLAVSAGADVDTLRALIDGGADLFAEDDQNHGALFLAAANGLSSSEDVNAITLLLDAIAKHEPNKNYVNTRDSSFMTPLIESCRAGNLPITRVLLEHGADVNMRDRNGFTALIHAALVNAPRELFELLLEHGAFIEGAKAMTRQGMTPLMVALNSQSIKPETVRLLIELGADPNYKNFQDISVLMLLIANSRPERTEQTFELVKTLLDCGADANLTTWDGLTPLIIAARIVNGNKDIFEALLKAGARVDGQNNQGMTALMIAAASCNETAVDCLLTAGADVKLQDIDGMTALCHVIQAQAQVQPQLQLQLQDQTQEPALVPDIKAMQKQAQSQSVAQNIIERLIRAGSEVNVQMSNGMTSLMNVAVRGQGQIFKMLLAAGADVTMRDSVGWTPLHFAARAKPDTECLSILLDSGADVNIGDNGGTTPLMVAAACDNAPAIKLLLDAGADISLMDRTGRDALSYARMRNSRECLPILEARR